MSEPALLVLLAHVSALEGLADWRPVGALVTEVLALQAGSGTITDTDAARLQRWARRWGALHPDLQTFYRKHAQSQAVNAALWAILDHKPAPTGAAYGRLRKLWTIHHGTRGSLALVPHLP